MKIETQIAAFREAQAKTHAARAAVPNVHSQDLHSQDIKPRRLEQNLAKQALLKAEDHEARLRASLADALDVAEASDQDVAACLTLHADVMAMAAEAQDAPARTIPELREKLEQHIKHVGWEVATRVYARRHANDLPVSARIAWTRGRGDPTAMIGDQPLYPIAKWLSLHAATATTKPELHHPGKLTVLEEAETDLRAALEKETREHQQRAARFQAGRSVSQSVETDHQQEVEEARRRELADAHRAREGAAQ